MNSRWPPPMTDIAEKMPIASLDELRFIAIDRMLLLAQCDQSHQLGEDVAMWRARVILYPLPPGPISLWPVDPTTVVGLVHVRGERVFIQRAELVAQVDERDAANTQNDAVQHQDAPHGQFNLLLVGRLDCLLQPGQARPMFPRRGHHR